MCAYVGVHGAYWLGPLGSRALGGYDIWCGCWGPNLGLLHVCFTFGDSHTSTPFFFLIGFSGWPQNPCILKDDSEPLLRCKILHSGYIVLGTVPKAPYMAGTFNNWDSSPTTDGSRSESHKQTLCRTQALQKRVVIKKKNPIHLILPIKTQEPDAGVKSY